MIQLKSYCAIREASGSSSLSVLVLPGGGMDEVSGSGKVAGATLASAFTLLGQWGSFPGPFARLQVASLGGEGVATAQPRGEAATTFSRLLVLWIAFTSPKLLGPPSVNADGGNGA